MEISPEEELFYQAADILQKVKDKKGSIKTLIYSSNIVNLRPLFALVNECVKYRTLLEEIASECSTAFHDEPSFQNSTEVAVVLLYEYLLGRKFGRAVNFRKLFQAYKNDIKTAVGKVLLKHKASTLKEAFQKSHQASLPRIPRYMRVNLIKGSVVSAIKTLQDEEWDYVGQMKQDEFSSQALSLTKWQFGLDPFLPDLLVFSPGTDFHNHPLTTSGVLVQQDRASCIPAHALSPVSGSTVLDCCAAPGNKTNHLASLMRNEGHVIALDRDMKRLATMRRLMCKIDATCVDMIHQDFLTVQPSSDDASSIQYILVDPSCSGSGMMYNQADSSGSDVDVKRIQTLKRFQISILKHALKFPNVKRVVYSTCSVHAEENEEVAEEVMSQVSQHFQFLKILPQWRGSRGLVAHPHADKFLRLSPQHDLTQGFFVACFERKENSISYSANDTESGLVIDSKSKKKGTKKKHTSSLIHDHQQDSSTNDSDWGKEETEESSEMNGLPCKKTKRKNKSIETDSSIRREEEHEQEVTGVNQPEAKRLKKRKKKRKQSVDDCTDEKIISEVENDVVQKKVRKDERCCSESNEQYCEAQEIISDTDKFSSFKVDSLKKKSKKRRK